MPGERTVRATVQSGVRRFRSTSRPAPTLRGFRRAERLEEDTRKGDWNKGAKEVRGISPGQPPSSGPNQNALGLWLLRGGVSCPHVSAPRARSARRKPAPAPEEAAKDQGLEGPRGQELVLSESAISSTWAWLPRCVLEILRRLGSVRSAIPHPMQTRGKAPQIAGDPSLRPRLSGVDGAAAAFESHLPGSAPPLGLSPASLLAAALSCRAALGTEVFALPGRRAPTLQQVELLGCLRQRLHPVSRPTATLRPQTPGFPWVLRGPRYSHPLRADPGSGC